jgi:hypothetical protein
MEISYSGGWEEGDRPSPAPFYMTYNGYGVLRNSWADGSYDFRSDAYLSATHKEQRFDGYYFFGDTIKTVLAEVVAGLKKYGFRTGLWTENGAFSEQVLSVSAPKSKSGNIKVNIAPVKGQYQGMEQQRAYQLMVHSRARTQPIKPP